MGRIKRKTSETAVHIRAHPLFVEYAKRTCPEENCMYDTTKKIAENLEEMLYGKKKKAKKE